MFQLGRVVIKKKYKRKKWEEFYDYDDTDIKEKKSPYDDYEEFNYEENYNDDYHDNSLDYVEKYSSLEEFLDYF